MKKAFLILPALSLLGSCGLIEASVRNAQFDLTVINEPGKPNSFGECQSLTVSLKNAKNGALTIRAADVQGQKVYSIPWTSQNGYAYITVVCDGNVNEQQTFAILQKASEQAALYKKSTAPSLLNSPDLLPDSTKGPFLLLNLR